MKSGQIKKSHGDSFKLKVALAALKSDKTVSELCQEFALSSSQIYAWKNQLEKRGIEIFADKKKTSNQDINIDRLHAIIGKLIVERELMTQMFGR
jgi:transposase-like protein